MKSLLIAALFAAMSIMMMNPSAFADNGRQVFNVDDYGAAPNTQSDSGPAIRKAIAAAIASGKPADVLFGDGAYRLGSITGGTWWPKGHLVVDGATDLALRGTGKTTLVMTDPAAAGVILMNCDKVVAQDLTVDYDPVPQIATKIVAIDPNHTYIDVEAVPGDPDMMTYDHPHFSDGTIRVLGTTYEVHSDGSVMWGGEPVGLMVTGPVGAGRWRLTVPPNPAHTRPDAIAVAGLRVGDLFITSAGGNVGAAFSMIKNKNAVANKITLHASPGLAFFPFNNDSVSLIGCTVEIKPGSHRVLSTDADGIHGRSNRHIEVIGCSLSGTGDDSINLHATAAVPLSRVSPSIIVFKRHTYTVRPGDTLEQVRPETGLVLGKYDVKSVDDSQKDGLHVEFVQPIDDVHFGTDFTSGDQFFNLAESSHNFIVRNNHFGTHRGRDLLLEAYQGIVENNVFDNHRTILQPPIVSSDPAFDNAMKWLMGTSIQMCYDPGWGEGPITEGITIRHNTFHGCELVSPAIWIADHVRSNGGYTPVGSHKDITIEGNTFINRNAPAIVARCVTNLVVKNNKIEGNGTESGATAKVPAFDLQQCVDPIVSDNDVPPGLYASLIAPGK